MMNQSCVVAQIDSIFGIIIELNLSQWKIYLATSGESHINTVFAYKKQHVFQTTRYSKDTAESNWPRVALFLMSI